jgi:hypothetical protein
MRTVRNLALVAAMLLGGKVFALGIDVGPVHIHGTKVKVGNTINLKIVADTITRDEDDKDRVRGINAHRKGDEDDKMTIKVIWADLDDDSKTLLKGMKTDTIYQAKLEKQDDDWKLLKIRNTDA